MNRTPREETGTLKYFNIYVSACIFFCAVVYIFLQFMMLLMLDNTLVPKGFKTPKLISNSIFCVMIFNTAQHIRNDEIYCFFF